MLGNVYLVEESVKKVVVFVGDTTYIIRVAIRNPQQ